MKVSIVFKFIAVVIAVYACSDSKKKTDPAELQARRDAEAERQAEEAERQAKEAERQAEAKRQADIQMQMEEAKRAKEKKWQEIEEAKAEEDMERLKEVQEKAEAMKPAEMAEADNRLAEEANEELAHIQDLLQKEIATHHKRKPATILIAVRGLRKQYLSNIAENIKNENFYQLLNIHLFIQNGLHAPEGIRPVFPTNPVPNLHTMVTGQYPAEHGIVAEKFYDKQQNRVFGVDPYPYSYPGDLMYGGAEYAVASVELGKKLYGGEPIWETMEKGEVACLYWPGCEFSKLSGYRKNRFVVKFEEIENWESRVEYIKQWLFNDADKMKLVLVDYRELSDVASKFGPDSPRVQHELKTFDDRIAELLKQLGRLLVGERFKLYEKPLTEILDGLNLNLIIVGTSGMRQLESQDPQLPEFDDKQQEMFEIWATDPSMWLVQPKEGQEENALNYFKNLKSKQKKHIEISKTAENEWHYKGNHDRIPSLLVTAKPGYKLSHKEGDKLYGDGYSPFDDDMQAAFIAYGPSFKKGMTVDKNKMGMPGINLLLRKLMDHKPATKTETVSTMA